MKAKESTAILILTMIFAFSACQKSANENAKVIDQNLPNSDASPKTLYKSIREVDFKNFTYQCNSYLCVSLRLHLSELCGRKIKN